MRRNAPTVRQGQALSLRVRADCRLRAATEQVVDQIREVGNVNWTSRTKLRVNIA